MRQNSLMEEVVELLEVPTLPKREDDRGGGFNVLEGRGGMKRQINSVLSWEWVNDPPFSSDPCTSTVQCKNIS